MKFKITGNKFVAIFNLKIRNAEKNFQISLKSLKK